MDVVVVRGGALGDFVATLPVLDALRERADTLWVFAAARHAVLFPRANRFVDIDSAEATRLFAGRLDRTFDLGVAWTASAAAALRKAGVVDVREGTPKPSGSVGDHLFSVLGRRDRDPRIVPDPEVVDAVRRRFGRPVVISPGSGGVRKRWPIARWREVAAALPDVLWVGGPLEVGEDWGKPRWDPDLRELCALASVCRAFLAPDSGPAHLARACGAPVGVVFAGDTDPAMWAPPGAAVFLADCVPDDLLAFVNPQPR